MTEMTTRTDAFEDVIAGLEEAIACQSVHGCSRQATWLAITHKPCGGPKRLCAEHVLRWMGEAMEIIAEQGEMRCPDCDGWFLTPEHCIRFRPL
jgi:hypothetical protein